ncbi:acyclic terpene utilization AtuA family protein [Streptomyces sp. NPDC059398]|uniref:acyclic terpene utilization AtuA family protein n=1 Tax=Streptomyces sp. NPDC059398 TaxID=3346820 RepID=UPI0036A3F5FB
MPVRPLRIGNASGFYGDRFGAMREMLTGGPLDVLTGDYLAELTMLILGRDRLKDPRAGYARTFLRQLEDCLGEAHDRGVKIVTNAGGLNPAGLADAIRELGERTGVPVRVAHVEGDALPLPDGALTANAYLGGAGIAACLNGGADVVVTGRVTDAALVTGPAAWHFGWGPGELDRLAGAVAAGHVLECGTQATGGNYSFFTGHDIRHPGFPVAEISADGSAVITKQDGTGGAVDIGTVTAQLLYETDGARYAGPDVTARLDTVRLTQDGPDRVRISGVQGEPPPATFKAGVTRIGGWRNEVVFVLTGLDIEAKAELVRAQVEDAFGAAAGGPGASRPADVRWELVRTDRADADTEECASALLRLVVRDSDREAVGRVVSGAAIELALGSYPGFHVTAPPGRGAPYGVFDAVYMDRGAVREVAVLPDGERVLIPDPPRTSESQGAVPPTRTAAVPPVPPASLPGPPSAFPDPPPALPGPLPAPQPDALPTPLPGNSPTRRIPLGRIAGARSGDKGGDVNVGVWVRTDPAWRWLAHALTVERFQELLPETRGLVVSRHVLPNLRALNFVVEGLLGEGVAAQTRFDAQGKGVGEWLRSRLVDVPAEAEEATPAADARQRPVGEAPSAVDVPEPRPDDISVRHPGSPR